MDETCIKLNGECVYLYRSIDTKGDTIDFGLSKKRDKSVAKYFFKNFETIVRNKTTGDFN